MKKSFKNKTSIILSFLIIFVFTLTGCTNKPVEKAESRGYIWEATKDNNTVTLVGTIHIGDNAVNLLNDDVKKILADTDVLSVELDLSSNSNIQKIQSASYLPQGETIDKYLSQDEVEKLTSIFKPLNLNSRKIENLNSFSLSSLFTNLVYAKAGIAGSGLDILMINEINSRKTKGDKVEVNELEGADFQLDMADDFFSWDSTKEFINNYSEDYLKNEINSATNLMEAFKNGDTKVLEDGNLELKNDSLEKYNMMLTDRNINMTNKIDELIKDGRKHTVAVGAGHFIGDDSVLKFLEEKGYTVTRIN